MKCKQKDTSDNKEDKNPTVFSGFNSIISSFFPFFSPFFVFVVDKNVIDSESEKP